MHYCKFLLPLFLVFGLLSCGGNGNNTQAYIKRTLRYKNVSGVDRDLLSLDVYHYNQPNVLRPVIIWVHGGGWRSGDKANQLQDKLNLFYGMDYIFVSVNYRLSPNPNQLNNPNRIKFPIHNEDVADAVVSVYNNIAQFGGDPDKMALLGHSAGAHLVSLTGTSPAFLPARQLARTVLKGVATIDTEGYDIPLKMSFPGNNDIYRNAFGDNNNDWVAASPITHVRNLRNYPDYFIAKRGSTRRKDMAEDFATALRNAGTDVTVVDGSVYDHAGINAAIGAPNETVITPALQNFFIQAFQ